MKYCFLRDGAPPVHPPAPLLVKYWKCPQYLVSTATQQTPHVPCTCIREDVLLAGADANAAESTVAAPLAAPRSLALRPALSAAVARAT